MDKHMENLAPAGTPEALERAVAAGADAVYLGYSAFSARAGAGNFDREALEAALRLAHLHHVRIHVTVNTLIRDEEMRELEQVLDLLYSLRVDAVLVQDLGVLQLLRAQYPDLPVHASTQMTIHNRTGVRFCRETGIRRVVLARECSLAEIRLCAEEKDMEIEVFSHGAQCVSVSGQCLFSSWIGGRSGNRGRCAQPCRLLYRYRGQTGAFLSPRDVCTREHLKDYLDAGVASLKIEGRLKRPEYVAVVAGSYAKGIRETEQGGDGKPGPEEMQALRQIFQRGGFMGGFSQGCEDAGVIDLQHVSHRGVEIGSVVSVTEDRAFARVRLTQDLHDGDQLAFSDQREGEMIYTGAEQRAGETARIRLRPGLKLEKNAPVRRLVDAAQLAAASALPMPKMDISMRLTAVPGTPLRLTLSDGENEVTVEGETTEPARTRAMTREDAERAFGKLGDTPFVLKSFTLEGGNAFVPVSALNALRRSGAEALAEKRREAFALRMGQKRTAGETVLPNESFPSMEIFRSPRQLTKTDRIPAWHPEDYREASLEEEIGSIPRGTWFCLPCVCEEATLQRLHAFVERHRDVFGGVVLGSVGQLGLSWPLPMGAGTGIPVMNRRAAAFLFERGLRFVTASPELTGQQMLDLRGGCGSILLPAYGRAQLMLLHTCPARVRLGLDRGHAKCQMCDRHEPDCLEGTELEDMHGARYPLFRERLPEGCLIRLMSPHPVNVLHRIRDASVLIELTDEENDSRLDGFLCDEGHWSRPVE